MPALWRHGVPVARCSTTRRPRRCPRRSSGWPRSVTNGTTGWRRSTASSPAGARARRLGHMSALLVGFGLGFFVGAQPGPVSLLCIRSVLRGALGAGIAIGAGAALIDLLYAALGLAGAASLLEA